MEAHAQEQQSPSSFGLITRSFMSNRPTERKVEIAKLWLRLARSGSVALCRLPSRVCGAADLRRIEQLGRELVMTRPTCATLALGTLKKGVHEHRMHEAAKADYTYSPNPASKG